MANKKLIVSQDKITAVADAIREKTSTTDTMTLDEMPGKISSISGGSSYTKIKLPDPVWYLDYEQNKLHIFQDQLVRMFGAEEWIQLTDNDVEIPWTDFSQYYTVSNNSMSYNSDRIIGISSSRSPDNIEGVYESVANGPDYSYKYYNGPTAISSVLPYGGSIYTIPSVKGKHTLKIRYKAANCSVSSPITLSSRVYSPLNNIGTTSMATNSSTSTVKSTITDNPFTDSNVITLPDYILNEYNINITDEALNRFSDLPALNGTLYGALSVSGTLKTTGVEYSYQITTASDNSKGKYPFNNEDGVLTSTNIEVGNSYSYAKISFTLSEAKAITLSCKSYGELGWDYGIISNIDKELSDSLNDDGDTGTTNVLYNFKSESSATFKDVSFGEVSAGKHFFTIKYRKDGSGNTNDDNFVVKLPSDVFYSTAVDTGKYLPSTITVTDADTGETLTDYTYDPYTGEFTIPMTHSWNMTAVASTLKNILDKVSYNMNYSTGIMTLSSTGATSYTYNIDNGEETTTTGDIDLTSLSDRDVHTITSMASADGIRSSGKNSYKVYKNMSDTMAINDIGFEGESLKNDDFINNNAPASYVLSFAYNGEIYKVYSKYVNSGKCYYYYFYEWPNTSAPVFTISSVSDTPIYSATIDMFTGEISNITTSTSFAFKALKYAMQVGNYIVFFSNDSDSPYLAGNGFFYLFDMTTHKWVARYRTKYYVFLISVDDEYLTLMADKDGSNISNKYYTITDKLSILMDSNHNVSLKITPMNISSKTVRVGQISILAFNSRYGISTSYMTSITYNKDTNDYTILAMLTDPNNTNNTADYRDMLYLKNVQLSDFNSDNTTVYPTFRINEDVFALTKKHLLTRDTNSRKIKIYEYAENSTGDGINMTKVGETTYTTGYDIPIIYINAVYYTSEYPSSFSRHIFSSFIKADDITVRLFY